MLNVPYTPSGPGLVYLYKDKSSEHGISKNATVVLKKFIFKLSAHEWIYFCSISFNFLKLKEFPSDT